MTCPVCSSPRHLLCCERVQLNATTSDRGHVLAAMRQGDMLAILTTDIERKVRLLPADQVALDSVFMHFDPTQGSRLLIEKTSEFGAVQGHILLLGCGHLQCHDIGIEREAVSPAVRSVCHAFDEALVEAGKLGCRRLIVEAGEVTPLTGAALAAALHCRLQLAQVQGQVQSLEEVELLASGTDAQELSRCASCSGPLCRSCPFTR